MKFAICLIFLFAGLISAGKYSMADAGLAVLTNVVKPYEMQHSVVDEFPEFFILDFFKGIWSGINLTFASDLTLFTRCVACPPKIWKVWVRFYEFIKNISWENIDQIIDQVMTLIGDTIGHALPCIILGMMIDKFVELILDPTWDNLKMALLKTLAANFQLILDDAMDMVGCIIKGDFFGAGEDVGQVLYVMIVH